MEIKRAGKKIIEPVKFIIEFIIYFSTEVPFAGQILILVVSHIL